MGDLTKAAETGEPMMPAFLDLLKVYNARARSASDVLKVCQEKSTIIPFTI